MAEKAAQGDSGWSSGQWLEEFAPGAVRERFASEIAAALEDGRAEVQARVYTEGEAEVAFSAGAVRAAEEFGRRQEEHVARVRMAVEQGPGASLVIGGRHIGYVARVWDDEDGLAFEVDWNDR